MLRSVTLPFGGLLVALAEALQLPGIGPWQLGDEAGALLLAGVGKRPRGVQGDLATEQVTAHVEGHVAAEHAFAE